jgi:hypothetical protein
VRQRVQTAYLDALFKVFPTASALPPGLALDAFLARPEIQVIWCRKLQVRCAAPLRVGVSQEEYDRLFYQPTLHQLQSRLLERLDSEDEKYRREGKYGDAGRDAVKRMLTPPIALVLSLLGALVHCMKLSMHLIQLATAFSVRAKGLVVLVGGIGLLSLAGCADNTPVTRHALYREYLEPQTRAHFSAPVAWMLRSTLHLQPVVYPWFNRTRTGLERVQDLARRKAWQPS